MSDFGDVSGVSSERGYSYQKLIAAYYLVVDNCSEIEYEVDGEDISIINEGPDRDSREYIQVKYQSTGSFSLSQFKNTVFTQLWDAYINELDRHNDKAILSTLVTNVPWDDTLRHFNQSCTTLRNRGISYAQFENSLKRHERVYKSMVGTRKNEDLRRFFWGFGVKDSLTLDYVKDKILEYMNKCNVRDPKAELAKIMQFISEKGQGRITRRKIEDIIGKSLTPIDKCIEKSSYSMSDIRKSFYDLDTLKTTYGTTEEFFDKDDLIWKMTLPAIRTFKRINFHLDNLNETSDFSSEEVDEARQIFSSNLDKINSEATEIASLTEDLLVHKSRYKNVIVSMQRTAADFGIELGGNESES
jgi:hypothetical protein